VASSNKTGSFLDEWLNKRKASPGISSGPAQVNSQRPGLTTDEPRSSSEPLSTGPQHSETDRSHVGPSDTSQTARIDKDGNLIYDSRRSSHQSQSQ
jgi:hypothetical protein